MQRVWSRITLVAVASVATSYGSWAVGQSAWQPPGPYRTAPTGPVYQSQQPAYQTQRQAYRTPNGHAQQQPHAVAPYGAAAPSVVVPSTGVPSAAADPYASYGIDPYYGTPYGAECCEAPYCEQCPPAPRWSASAAGLILSIDSGSHYNFSFDDSNEALQFTDWHDTQIEWDGGFEVILRRLDACSCTGWEFVYWQLDSDTAGTTTRATDVVGGLDGILNWDQLDYNSNGADTYVDDAQIHRLRHNVDIYNMELSHYVGWGHSECGTPNVHLLFGARVLRFEDDLNFASDPDDGSFTGEVDEIHYDINTENTLYGLQAGLWSEQPLAHRLSLTMGFKAGVFANHSTAYSRIGGAAGTATVNNGPNNNRAFLVNSEKDDLAMLAELQLDVRFALTHNWYAGLGYRAIGASGVAITVDQIYHDLRGLQDIKQIDSDGSLLIHGARAYAEWAF